MKSGHFMAAPYTLCVAHEAMNIHIIHWCHQVLFLASPHPINPHYRKPHEQAFLLLQNGPVYLFNYLYGIFRYTTFYILFLPFFYNNEGKT